MGTTEASALHGLVAILLLIGGGIVGGVGVLSGATVVGEGGFVVLGVGWLTWQVWLAGRGR